MSSSSQGEANELVVLEALVSLGGSATPAGLRQTCGLAERTFRAASERLERGGYVKRSKALVEITAPGSERAAPAPPDLPADALDLAAEALLPPWHAAFARLQADAVVARRVCPDRKLQPGFIAFGPPRTAKTLGVEFVIRSLGLEGQSQVVLLSTLARGELLGRRVAAGAGGYRFERSPLIECSLLCLDEFANADQQLQTESLKLLQGDPELVIENSTVRVSPVTVVLFNPRSGSQPRIPEAIYRRSFTLDTSAAGQALGPFEAGFAEFYASPAGTLVNLGSLRLIHAGMPASARQLLLSIRQESGPLTEMGKVMWDLPKLELCSIGRAARWRIGASEDPGAAAAGVILDALTCFETVNGWVRPTWREDMLIGDWRRFVLSRPGGERFLENAERGRESQRILRSKAVEAHRAQVSQGLEIDGRRAELTEALVMARRSIERVPAEHRIRAAGIRERARKLQGRTGEARSANSLIEVAQLAGPVLIEARALAESIAETRRRLAESTQAAANQRKETLRIERERADAGRKTRKVENERKRKIQGRLGRWRSACTALQRRKRAKSAAEVANALVEAGALRRMASTQTVPASPSPKMRGIARLVQQKVAPQFEEVEVLWYLDIYGRSYRTASLRSWSDPAVAEILRSTIEKIDQLRSDINHGAVGAIGIGWTELPPGFST